MTYKINKKNKNRDWMLSNGFRYAKPFSDECHSVYSQFIPIWKQKDTIALEVRIIACLETGEVKIDVYDSSFHGRYAPYYLRPTYYEDFLQTLDQKIDNILKNYDIKGENE